jgi:hypothetical protein
MSDELRLPELAQLGSATADVFVRIASVERLKTKNDQPYWNLQLGDASASMNAKVWSDHPDFEVTGQFAVGTVVKVRGRRDEYRGEAQLRIERIREVIPSDEWNPEQLFGAGFEMVRDLMAPRLVFDIETAPICSAGDLPTKIQSDVHRLAEDRGWPTEKVLGLNPLFSRIVSIAVGDLDAGSAKDAVLFAPRDEDVAGLATEAENEAWLRVAKESDMLHAFWTLTSSCELLVSYNGRGFDLPFLRTRSAILQVPARRDFVSQPPYVHRPHLDLYQIVTGGMRGGPMNLDAACYAFGIESPKDAMDGSQVGPAFHEGRYLEIARYNLADIEATRSLFHRLDKTVIAHLGG